MSTCRVGFCHGVEKERALGALEQAFRDHEPCMISLKVDAIFDPLREEPRFKELVRGIRLEPTVIPATKSATEVKIWSRFCKPENRKFKQVKKGVVGSWGLEPQTSTVSR